MKELLNYRFERLGPEEKFFILLFLMRLEEIKEGGLGVKAISRLLGITDRVVSNALNYLIDERLLVVNKIRQEEGGFFVSYVLHEKLTNLLGSECSAPLESFVIETAQDTYTDKTHKLKLANRLLLSVLFINADENGVVRNLGVADLAKLTGMSRDRLKSQLEKLMDLEYIRFFIPGVTGAYMFGVAKGAYFLNLNHDLFLCAVKPEQVVVLLYDEDFWKIRNQSDWDFFWIGYKLRILKERLNEKISDGELRNQIFNQEFNSKTRLLGSEQGFQLLNGDEAKTLLAFFQDKPLGRKIVRYFGYKLDILVSQFLTEAWGVLDDCRYPVSLHSSRSIKEHELVKSFKITIKNEFSPLKPKEETSESQVKVLIDYVFYLVLLRARLIKSVLEDKGLVSPEGKRYQVLTHHNRDHLVFFSYQRKPDHKGVDSSLFLKRGALPAEERLFSKDELYLYGLLSRPVRNMERLPKKDS